MMRIPVASASRASRVGAITGRGCYTLRALEPRAAITWASARRQLVTAETTTLASMSDLPEAAPLMLYG